METMEMQEQLAGSDSPGPQDIDFKPFLSELLQTVHVSVCGKDYVKNIRCIFTSLFFGVALQPRSTAVTPYGHTATPISMPSTLAFCQGLR